MGTTSTRSSGGWTRKVTSPTWCGPKGEENVKALVYLSGYALTEGESLAELQGRFADSLLASGLVYRSYPVEGSADPGTDVYVDPAKFREIFAADVEQDLARVLAVSQRPLGAAAFTEKAAVAGGERSRPGPSCKPPTTRSTLMWSGSAIRARGVTRSRSTRVTW